MVMSRLKNLLAGQTDIAWLCLSAFFMSFQYGIYSVAFPFIMRNIGGSDKDIGLCLALGFTGYFVGCLIGGPLIDHFNAKRLVQFASAGVAVGVAALTLLVVLESKNRWPFNPVITVMIISAFSGLVAAFYWPTIQGWVSVGHEGPGLNRKLALYNLSWSSGLVTSQYLGGILAEISHTLSLVVVTIFMIAVFTAASLAKKPASSHVHLANGSKRNAFDLDPLLPKFRMMARVALIMVLMCIGLARSQVALLFTEELGYSESQYGIAMMVMCGAIWLIFFAVSRTHAWHYKFGLFIIVQLLTGLSMLIIIN